MGPMACWCSAATAARFSALQYSMRCRCAPSWLLRGRLMLRSSSAPNTTPLRSGRGGPPDAGLRSPSVARLCARRQQARAMLERDGMPRSCTNAKCAFLTTSGASSHQAGALSLGPIRFCSLLGKKCNPHRHA